MKKVRLICDTTADLTAKEIEELDIRLVPIPLIVEGEGCLETDFTPEEFYRRLEAAREIPATSHVTSATYLGYYEDAFREGYRRVINVTLNAKGSQSYEAACMAVELFFDQYPQARDQGMQIAVVDGRSYSLGYGYGVIAAGHILKNGGTFREALDYLEHFLRCSEVYFSVFTLKFARKSGRISAAAAFAGEVLGFRPVLQIKNGEMTIAEKVRGNQAVIAALARAYEERCRDYSFPYAIIRGKNPEPARQLEEKLRAISGHKAYGTYYAGASVAINSGPDLVGVAFLGSEVPPQAE